jgi:hypothetical protein
MAAGLAEHIRTCEEIAALLDQVHFQHTLLTAK